MAAATMIGVRDEAAEENHFETILAREEEKVAMEVIEAGLPRDSETGSRGVPLTTEEAAGETETGADQETDQRTAAETKTGRDTEVMATEIVATIRQGRSKPTSRLPGDALHWRIDQLRIIK